MDMFYFAQTTQLWCQQGEDRATTSSAAHISETKQNCIELKSSVFS